MAGKVLQVTYNFDGQLAAGFTQATQMGGKALSEMANRAKEAAKVLSPAAQRRLDLQSFRNIGKAAREVGKDFSALKSELLGTAALVGGATAAAGAAIYGVVKTSANFADATIKNAASAGMEVEAFAKLAHAADLGAVSQEEFVNSAAKLAQTYTDALAGSQQALDTFLRAGIALRDNEGNLKTTEQLYMEIADVFATMGDGVGKTDLSRDLFGRSGVKMISFLNAGSAGLKALGEEAKRLGIVLSKQDYKNAEEFNDSLTVLGKSFRGLSLIIGKELWPELAKAAREIAAWVSESGALLGQDIAAWFREVKQEMPYIREELRNAWYTAKDFALAANSIVQAMGGWVPVIKSVVYAWLAYKAIKLDYLIAKNIMSMGGFVKSIWAAKGAVRREGIPTFWAWGRSILKLRPIMKGAGHAVMGFVRALLLTAYLNGSMMYQGAIQALPALKAGFIAAAVAAKGFALALLLNPITWIVAGIVALVAAVYYLWKHWDTVSGWLVTAWNWWGDVASAACTGIADAADWVAGKAGEAWDWMGEKLDTAASWWGDVASSAYTGIADAAGWTAGKAGEAWDLMGDKLDTAESWWGDVASSAYTGIADAASWTAGKAGEAWDLMGDKLDTAGTWFGNAAGSAFSAISEKAETCWTSAVDIFGRGIDNVSAWFQTKKEAVTAAFDKGIIEGITELIRQFNPITIFSDIFNSLVEWIKSFPIVQAGIDFAKNLGQVIIDGFLAIKDGVVSTVTDWMPGKGYLSAGASAVGDAASGAWNYAKSLIPGHAYGGIITHPQIAMVGEAGPEAIVPLANPGRAAQVLHDAGLSGGGFGGSFTFAPTINITGGGSGDDVASRVESSLRRQFDKFRRMLADVAHENARLALR